MLRNRLWEAGFIAFYRELIEKRAQIERDWHDTGLQIIEGQHQAICSVVSLMSKRIAEIEELEIESEGFETVGEA